MSKTFRARSTFLLPVAAAAVVLALGAGCGKKKPLDPAAVTLTLDRQPPYYESGEVAYAAIAATNPNAASMTVSNLTPDTVAIFCADAKTNVPMPQPAFADADAAPSGTAELAAAGATGDRLDANWSIEGLPSARGEYMLYVIYTDEVQGTKAVSSFVPFTIE